MIVTCWAVVLLQLWKYLGALLMNWIPKRRKREPVKNLQQGDILKDFLSRTDRSWWWWCSNMWTFSCLVSWYQESASKQLLTEVTNIIMKVAPCITRGPAKSAGILKNPSYPCMIFVKGRENGTHFPVELTISESNASLTIWKGAISHVKWWLDWQNSSYCNSIFHKQFLLERNLIFSFPLRRSHSPSRQPCFRRWQEHVCSIQGSVVAIQIVSSASLMIRLDFLSCHICRYILRTMGWDRGSVLPVRTYFTDLRRTPRLWYQPRLKIQGVLIFYP